MEIIIRENETIEVKAAEGMVLTNGETFSDVGDSVLLGINDVPENWNEITAEEATKRKNESTPTEDVENEMT